MSVMKKQTSGYFDFIGMIKGFGAESFKKDLQGSNNPNWIYNKLSFVLTDGGGKSIYINVQDGYDNARGKYLYLQSVDNEPLKIDFKDRFNEGIRSAVKDTSFFKVATKKVNIEAKNRDTGETIMENGVPKMVEVWDYTRFLSVYDMLLFLSDKLTDGLKVRMTGQVKYREYNGNTQREYSIQRVYFLPEGDDTSCEFKLTQTVALDSDSVDMSRFETDNIVTLKSKIYQKKNKEEMELIPLDLVLRTTEEKKESCRRGVDMMYTVTGDTIRKITLECIINSGYIQTDATVDFIPKELQELIDLGFYTKEEVLKNYTNREKVDEIQIIKPVVRDMQFKDDEYYVKSDFENLKIEREESEEIGFGELVLAKETVQPASNIIDEYSLEKELGLV